MQVCTRIFTGKTGLQAAQRESGIKYSTRLSDAVYIAAFIRRTPPKPHIAHANPACGVDVSIQLSLSRCCAEVQRSAEVRMAEITLSDILRIYEEYVRGNEATK